VCALWRVAAQRRRGTLAIVTVKAWLEGHQFDLEDLVDLLPAGELRVVKEGDRYYLTALEIDNPPTEKQFCEVAPDTLARVNGLGRAHNPSFRPVQLTGTYQEGDHRHHVVTAGTIEVRAKVYAAAVVTSPHDKPTPPPVGPRHAAVKDANVSEALAIMGQPSILSWVELYKIYEIVRASGALHTAAQAAGLTPIELKLFTHTANHPEASGDDGRHARSQQRPPKNPMSIEQARDLVSRLVRTWLDCLA
jgi:hypothetical protein